jgi:hypothetical protein
LVGSFLLQEWQSTEDIAAFGGVEFPNLFLLRVLFLHLLLLPLPHLLFLPLVLHPFLHLFLLLLLLQVLLVGLVVLKEECSLGSP